MTRRPLLRKNKVHSCLVALNVWSVSNTVLHFLFGCENINWSLRAVSRNGFIEFILMSYRRDRLSWRNMGKYPISNRLLRNANHLIFDAVVRDRQVQICYQFLQRRRTHRICPVRINGTRWRREQQRQMIENSPAKVSGCNENGWCLNCLAKPKAHPSWRIPENINENIFVDEYKSPPPNICKNIVISPLSVMVQSDFGRFWRRSQKWSV